MSRKLDSQSGSALVELVIVLPVLIIMTGALIALGSLMQQLFWFEQTSYNATRYATSLPTSVKLEERRQMASNKAAALGTVHRYEQKFHLISFEPTTDIESKPFDTDAAYAAPTDPTKRFVSVTLRGYVEKLFLFGLPIKSSLTGSSLSPLPQSSSKARFCGSNTSALTDPLCGSNYGDPNCCGDYGGGAVGSCVTGVTYKCNDVSKIGYMQ